ncbi:MAG: FtsX-like permease family protein [Candidatus Methanofastidiosum sp.]|nr:FtsX-like permease family protein [Methanofastidiosum sp.]
MGLISRIGIYFKYASSSLLRRKQKTLFSLLAISLSVAAIIAIGIVSYSAEYTISGTVKSDLGGDLRLNLRGGGFQGPGMGTTTTTIDFDLIEDFLSGLKDAGTIEEYTYTLNGMAVTDSDEPTMIRFVAIDPGVYPLYGEIITIEPNVGDYSLLFQDTNDILITDTLSDNLGLESGSTILVIIDDQLVELNIAGVVSTGTGDISDYAYMEMASFKELFNYDVNENPPSQIVIRTQNDYLMEDTVNLIESELNEREKYNIRTTTYIEQSENTLSSLEIVFTFFKLSGIVALLVGGLGIITTMYISMKERKKEIGIMKAIGIKNINVIFFFIVEALLLGLIGSSAGVVLGILLSKQLAVVASSIFRTSLIWTINTDTLLYGFLLGLFSTMVFQLLPAYIGSRIRPIIVLKDMEGDDPFYKDIGFFIITILALLIFGAIININLNSWSLVLIIYVMIIIMLGFTIFCRYLVKAISHIPTFGFLSIKMALKNLERNCWTIATALLAISIGLGTVGAVLIAGESVKSSVSESLSNNLNYDMQIMSIPESTIKQVEERILLTEGISNIYRYSISISDCYIESINGRPISNYLYRMSDEDREFVEDRYMAGVSISGQNIGKDIVNQQIVSGRLLSEEDIGRNNIIITSRGANYFGIKVGDKILFKYQDYPIEMTVVGLYTQTSTFGPGGGGSTNLGLMTSYETVERIRKTSNNKDFNIIELNGSEVATSSVTVNIVGNGLENEYFPIYEDNSVIISKALSNLTGLKVGDTISLELNEQTKTFEVREIREGPFNLEANIIIPYSSLKDSFSGIYTYTLAIDAEEGYEEIAMKKLSLMFPDYRIFEVSRIQEMVTRIIDQVLIPISIIASFSLFVAVIVIANMMYISTLDRKREFAIMKAIGARNRSVLKNIAIENISAGLTGGFTSLLVLYLASQLMSMFLGLDKSIISLIFMVELIGLSVLISVFASIIPAYNIVKIRPLSVLRYE